MWVGFNVEHILNVQSTFQRFNIRVCINVVLHGVQF